MTDRAIIRMSHEKYSVVLQKLQICPNYSVYICRIYPNRSHASIFSESNFPSLLLGILKINRPKTKFYNFIRQGWPKYDDFY